MANWETDRAPIGRTGHYVDMTHGKLKQRVSTSGVQIYDTGDSTTVGQEHPALPSAPTYPLRWRWSSSATPPVTCFQAEEGENSGTTEPNTGTGEAAKEEEVAQSEEPHVGATTNSAGALSSRPRAQGARSSTDWDDFLDP